MQAQRPALEVYVATTSERSGVAARPQVGQEREAERFVPFLAGGIEPVYFAGLDRDHVEFFGSLPRWSADPVNRVGLHDLLVEQEGEEAAQDADVLRQQGPEDALTAEARRRHAAAPRKLADV